MEKKLLLQIILNKKDFEKIKKNSEKLGISKSAFARLAISEKIGGF